MTRFIPFIFMVAFLCLAYSGKHLAEASAIPRQVEPQRTISDVIAEAESSEPTGEDLLREIRSVTLPTKIKAVR